MNATTAFGAVLRRYREAAGMSQEHLAERAGLSLRGISDLERGARTTPGLETVRMLADGTAGLATRRRLNGDLDGAMTLVREAVATFREVGDDIGALSCLDVVADIAASVGDHALAAWCIGAVDRVLEENGLVRIDISPDEHMKRVALITRSLGEPGWRKHWTDGYGQAIDDALEVGLAWDRVLNATMAQRAGSSADPERERCVHD